MSSRVAGTITNLDTGEQSDAVFEQNRHGRGKPKERATEFTMVWMDALGPMQLSAVEMRVLDKLVRASDHRGIVRYRLRDIAEWGGNANARDSYAWRVVDSIVRKGAAIKHDRGMLRVNPYVMWSGNLADRSSAVIKWHSALANAERTDV